MEPLTFGVTCFAAPARPSSMLRPPRSKPGQSAATATHFYGMDAEAMGPIWPTWFLKDTELAWLSGYPSIDDL